MEGRLIERGKTSENEIPLLTLSVCVIVACVNRPKAVHIFGVWANIQNHKMSFIPTKTVSCACGRTLHAVGISAEEHPHWCGTCTIASRFYLSLSLSLLSFWSFFNLLVVALQMNCNMEKWENAFGFFLFFSFSAVVSQERGQIQTQSIHSKYAICFFVMVSVLQSFWKWFWLLNNDGSIQVTTIQNYDNDHDSLALVTFGQKALPFPKRISCNNFVGFIICFARIMKPWRKWAR